MSAMGGKRTSPCLVWVDSRDSPSAGSKPLSWRQYCTSQMLVDLSAANAFAWWSVYRRSGEFVVAAAIVSGQKASGQASTRGRRDGLQLVDGDACCSGGSGDSHSCG